MKGAEVINPDDHLPPNAQLDILIAEDSPTQAQRLLHILQQHNYKARVAVIGRLQYMLLNRTFRHQNDSGMGVEIHFNGQRHYITADRLQILNLLLSTYDAAIQRNQELSASQQTLERKSAEVEEGHRFLDSV